VRIRAAQRTIRHRRPCYRAAGTLSTHKQRLVAYLMINREWLIGQRVRTAAFRSDYSLEAGFWSSTVPVTVPVFVRVPPLSIVSLPLARGACCAAEIPRRPQMLPPISFAQLGKFILKQLRASSRYCINLHSSQIPELHSYHCA
jgi:hypothetical protein